MKSRRDSDPEGSDFTNCRKYGCVVVERETKGLMSIRLFITIMVILGGILGYVLNGMTKTMDERDVSIAQAQKELKKFVDDKFYDLSYQLLQVQEAQKELLKQGHKVVRMERERNITYKKELNKWKGDFANWQREYQ